MIFFQSQPRWLIITDQLSQPLPKSALLLSCDRLFKKSSFLEGPNSLFYSWWICWRLYPLIVMFQALEADVQELEMLLGKAGRPTVRTLLQAALNDLKQQLDKEQVICL